jgi:hypothetical protein
MPKRGFTQWLGDAQLRGEGSTLTTTLFFAASGCSNWFKMPDEDSCPTHDFEEAIIKGELRSLAGRLLWKEVWGHLVTGGQWWWDDEECVRECMKFKTVWEYHVIDAVRDD